MASSDDIRDFLTTRRGRLTPAQAGITEYGRARRVKGLKREEVALLAGVSSEYYAKLERGNLRGVSDSVLNAVARALQLDEAERLHLFDLARAAAPSHEQPATRRASTRARTEPRASVLQLLDSFDRPAYVRNARLDILAANRHCYALYHPILAPERMPINLARFTFLDPRASQFFVEWETVADDMAAALRVEAGRSPTDQHLTQLVGELATNSTAFSDRWARHDVKLHRTARKTLHNPVIGDIELTGEALDLAGDGLTMIAYTADPDSRAREQLDFLASWSSTGPEERGGRVPADQAD